MLEQPYHRQWTLPHGDSSLMALLKEQMSSVRGMERCYRRDRIRIHGEYYVPRSQRCLSSTRYLSGSTSSSFLSSRSSHWRINEAKNPSTYRTSLSIQKLPLSKGFIIPIVTHIPCIINEQSSHQTSASSFQCVLHHPSYLSAA